MTFLSRNHLNSLEKYAYSREFSCNFYWYRWDSYLKISSHQLHPRQETSKSYFDFPCRISWQCLNLPDASNFSSETASSISFPRSGRSGRRTWSQSLPSPSAPTSAPCRPPAPLAASSLSNFQICSILRPCCNLLGVSGQLWISTNAFKMDSSAQTNKSNSPSTWTTEYRMSTWHSAYSWSMSFYHPSPNSPHPQSFFLTKPFVFETSFPENYKLL